MLRAFNERLAQTNHVDLTVKDVLRYVNDAKYLVIVGLAGPPGPRRPGVWLFYTIAEYTFYDPTVPGKSDQWQLVMQMWNDMCWGIGIFPAPHHDKLERVAKRRCGLYFSRGIPQVWSDPKYPNVICQGASRRLIVPNADLMFPLDSRNLRTLEYLDKPMTAKEENDQLSMWMDHGKERSRTNWWPDVIGE